MEPIRIFISYAHKNDIWLRETVLDRVGRLEQNPKDLLTYWRDGLQFEGEVEFWYDREKKEGLLGGDPWEKRIFDEIDRADIGVLLITQEFVQASYIRRKELPRMLARAERGEMEIVPVLVEPSEWEDLELASFQLTPGRPTPLLQSLSEHEQHFKTAMLDVLKSLKARVRRVRQRRETAAKQPPAPPPVAMPGTTTTPPPRTGKEAASHVPQSRPPVPTKDGVDQTQLELAPLSRPAQGASAKTIDRLGKPVPAAPADSLNVHRPPSVPLDQEWRADFTRDGIVSWHQFSHLGVRWAAADGVCKGGGAGYLTTPDETWADFVLEVDVRITTTAPEYGAAGILVRCLSGRDTAVGYHFFLALLEKEGFVQAQVYEKKEQFRALAVRPCAVELGRWYRMGLVATGASMLLSIDGQPACQVNDLFNLRGGIGLRVGKAEAEFRNMVVRRGGSCEVANAAISLAGSLATATPVAPVHVPMGTTSAPARSSGPRPSLASARLDILRSLPTASAPAGANASAGMSAGQQPSLRGAHLTVLRTHADDNAPTPGQSSSRQAPPTILAATLTIKGPSTHV